MSDSTSLSPNCARPDHSSLDIEAQTSGPHLEVSHAYQLTTALPVAVPLLCFVLRSIPSFSESRTCHRPHVPSPQTHSPKPNSDLTNCLFLSVACYLPRKGLPRESFISDGQPIQPSFIVNSEAWDASSRNLVVADTPGTCYISREIEAKQRTL